MSEPKNASERIRSLEREGWHGSFAASVYLKGLEVAVVMPSGTYYRGFMEAESPKPKEQNERRTKSVE